MPYSLTTPNCLISFTTANVRRKLKEGYSSLNAKIEALDFDVEHEAEKELSDGIDVASNAANRLAQAHASGLANVGNIQSSKRRQAASGEDSEWDDHPGALYDSNDRHLK